MFAIAVSYVSKCQKETTDLETCLLTSVENEALLGKAVFIYKVPSPLPHH